MYPAAISAFVSAPGLRLNSAFAPASRPLDLCRRSRTSTSSTGAARRRSARHNVTAVDTQPAAAPAAPASAVRPPVPVTILTGFLGSGKTTLLNNILNDTSHGMKFAVIENEYGEVGIDEKVLSENVEDEVIEVMNGCICCTVRSDLITALNRLYERVESFDGIIIETTGIADPAPVCQTFFLDEAIGERYRLDSVITVVDSKYILDRIHEQKAEGAENEAVEQVVFADKILVNKTDLVDEAQLQEVEKQLRAMNPTAAMVRSQYVKVPPTQLLNQQAFEIERVLDMDPGFLEPGTEHQHDDSVSSISVRLNGEVNMMMLDSWINRILRDDGANLYRYKGVIAVKGIEQKFLFQGVGMLFQGAFCDFKWKEGEARESVFVFIGKNLDHDFYREGFKACREEQELRFPVGSWVEANVGDFQLGKVVKHWDEGNAYRIELQDDEKTHVLAPIDIDAYIRAP